jgi:ISXO2-like transposase domain
LMLRLHSTIAARAGVREPRLHHHALDEYVNRDDPTIHTNTVEGVFSIVKRGMRGIYQHCGEKHLHHYLAEFDFRYKAPA